jgi:hypothetical protein
MDCSLNVPGVETYNSRSTHWFFRSPNSSSLDNLEASTREQPLRTLTIDDDGIDPPLRSPQV